LAVAGLGIGSVMKSNDDRLMLAQEDLVVVGLSGTQSLKAGDRLAVIRPGERVFHPSSRKMMGQVLNTLGIIEVSEIRERTVLGRVAYACDAITIRDRVVPFSASAFPEDKVPQPTNRNVEGTIVQASFVLQMLAPRHLVFLDVGQAQGVGLGDVFVIYRPIGPTINPATGKEEPIPPVRLGEAVAIRVTDRTVTAVLTESGKESQPGDRVVLSRQIQP